MCSIWNAYVVYNQCHLLHTHSVTMCCVYNNSVFSAKQNYEYVYAGVTTEIKTRTTIWVIIYKSIYS